MSSIPLVLVGGGEHARVVAEAARSRPGVFDLLGFVDPAPCYLTVQLVAIPRLGGDEALESNAAQVILGIGAIGINSVRKDLVARLPRRQSGWARVIDARAWVSPSASIGEGTVVMAGAIVQTGAKVGVHCVINSGAVVEHDVELGDFAQVGPAAAIGGGAVIGEGSYVGLGARVRDHIRIGSRVLIGMGAVVVSDVPDGLCVTGVPARTKSK